MILLASTNIEHSFFFILCAPFICVSRNIRSGGQGVLSPHWSQGGHLSERNSEAPQSVGYILCLLAVMRSLLLGRKELAEKESRPAVILHRLETADEDLRSYNHADFRKVVERRSVRMSVCRLCISRLVVFDGRSSTALSCLSSRVVALLPKSCYDIRVVMVVTTPPYVMTGSWCATIVDGQLFLPMRRCSSSQLD